MKELEEIGQDFIQVRQDDGALLKMITKTFTKEREFSSTIVSYFNASSNSEVSAIGEMRLPHNDELNDSYVDVAFKSKSDQKLVGILEVGLVEFAEATRVSEKFNLDQKFWEKVDQIMNYLVRCPQVEGTPTKGDHPQSRGCCKFDDEVLIAVLVLVVSKKPTKRIEGGRLAVFVCQPKPDESFRVTLLHHKEIIKGEEGVSDVQQKLASEFGFFINALECLTTIKSRPSGPFKMVSMNYLDPDCAQVVTVDGKKQLWTFSKSLVTTTALVRRGRVVTTAAMVT